MKLDFVDVNATRIDSLSSPTMRKLETLCQVSSFFRVPVPEICYYRFANSWARNVLRCDQWDAVAEPLVVILKCLKHFVICSFWIQFQDHRLTNSNAVDNKEFLTSAAPKECFPMLALKKRKMMHLILLLNPSMRSNRFYPEFASKNATPRQARSEIGNQFKPNSDNRRADSPSPNSLITCSRSERRERKTNTPSGNGQDSQNCGERRILRLRQL